MGADTNGLWTIVFGKKINGKDVYKRDGDVLFLMVNDRGDFQMSKEKTGACTGFAIKKDGVWTFDGDARPDVKVKPLSDNGEVPPPKKVDLTDVLAKEAEARAREDNSQTFRGTLSEEDEQSGDRLMSKMGAKIVNGL